MRPHPLATLALLEASISPPRKVKFNGNWWYLNSDVEPKYGVIQQVLGDTVVWRRDRGGWYDWSSKPELYDIVTAMQAHTSDVEDLKRYDPSKFNKPLTPGLLVQYGRHPQTLHKP